METYLKTLSIDTSLRSPQKSVFRPMVRVCWPLTQIYTLGNCARARHVLWYIKRLGALCDLLCTRDKITLNSTRPDNFTTTPVQTPHVSYTNFAQCNESCQIFSSSVQGFRSPRGPNIAISYWLEPSHLQKCYALMCYTVITNYYY